MIEIFGFWVLLDNLLLRKVIIVDLCLCLLFISSSVWLDVILCKFVGLMRFVVLLMGWLLMFREGIILFSIESILELFCVVKVLDLIIFNGIGEFIMFFGVFCVFIMVICFSWCFLLFCLFLVIFLLFCVFIFNVVLECIFILLVVLVIIVSGVFFSSNIKVLLRVKEFDNVLVLICLVMLKGNNKVVFVCLVSFVNVVLVFCVGIEKVIGLLGVVFCCVELDVMFKWVFFKINKGWVDVDVKFNFMSKIFVIRWYIFVCFIIEFRVGRKLFKCKWWWFFFDIGVI